MGIRTKVIPLTRQFFGTDPQFEAGDDYLKTTLSGSLAEQLVPENVPEKRQEKNSLFLKVSLKRQARAGIVPDQCQPVYNL